MINLKLLFVCEYKMFKIKDYFNYILDKIFILQLLTYLLYWYKEIMTYRKVLYLIIQINIINIDIIHKKVK